MSAADSSVNVLGTGTVPIDTSFGTDTTSGSGVYRQRMVVGDDISFGALASVINAPPASTAYGLVTRVIGGNGDFEEIKELLFELLIVNKQILECLRHN